MAGQIKEGSVMEGIFAMYCAAYLIDPNNGKSDTAIENFINDLRVDTQLGNLITAGKKSVDYTNTFPGKLGTAKKRFGKDISVIKGKEAKEMIPVSKSPKYKKKIAALINSEKFFETVGVKGYPDFTQVELKVRVKEAETGDYYGPKLQKLLDEEKAAGKSKDKTYISIKERMRFLIRSKKNTFFKRLQNVKAKYLSNKESEVVHWPVDADGIAGETSGGDIKQDVTIVISADGTRILSEELNFSLKASSKTIHGGGVYNTMPQVYEIFEGVIPKDDIKRAKRLIEDIKKGTAQYNAKESVDSLWKLIGENLPDLNGTPNTKWNDHFWGVLERRLFGKSSEYSGKIQLLEMNNKDLSEVTEEQFDKLKNSGVKLYPIYRRSKPGSQSPGEIRIMPLYKGNKKDPKESSFVYKMRAQYRNDLPKKIAIELGGKDSIIHDENWEKFVKKGYVDEINT